MSKLTDDEIRRIIKRASVLQIFHESSPGKAHFQPDEYESLYEIADNLDINRNYVREALLEYEGIESDDPISVNTGNSHDVEIVANINGSMDGGLLNEIKTQLEYHFNTVGKIQRRKNRIFWNAKPAGPSRLFALTNSPELEIEEKSGRMKFSLKQSLKTINKFYLPAVAATFGALMMFSAVVLEAAHENDVEPLVIMSGIFFVASFFYARFVKGRKQKRKDKLVELMEVLQQITERRFRSEKIKVKSEPETLPEIEFDDIEENDIDNEIVNDKRIRS